MFEFLKKPEMKKNNLESALVLFISIAWSMNWKDTNKMTYLN